MWKMLLSLLTSLLDTCLWMRKVKLKYSYTRLIGHSFHLDETWECLFILVQLLLSGLFACHHTIICCPISYLVPTRFIFLTGLIWLANYYTHLPAMSILGTQFKTIVEYAPSQRVPKHWPKKDAREGTILKGIKMMSWLHVPYILCPFLPAATLILLMHFRSCISGVPWISCKACWESSECWDTIGEKGSWTSWLVRTFLEHFLYPPCASNGDLIYQNESWRAKHEGGVHVL